MEEFGGITIFESWDVEREPIRQYLMVPRGGRWYIQKLDLGALSEMQQGHRAMYLERQGVYYIQYTKTSTLFEINEIFESIEKNSGVPLDSADI